MKHRIPRTLASAAGGLGLALASVAAGPSQPASAASLSPAASTASGTPTIEVCGQGAGLVKPDSVILTCADDGELAVHLDWNSWTAAGATASGLVTWRQACASAAPCAGKASWASSAAQITLSGPVSEPGHGITFTKLRLQVTGSTPSGFMRDLTFDETPSSSSTAGAQSGSSAVTPQAPKSAVTPAAASGQLGYAKIEGYWIDAGGPSGVAETAAAITGAESSFLPGIIQQGVDYCGAGADRAGWGLWQITCGNSVPAYGTNFQLLDPWNNAEAAVSKYHADAAAGLNGFDPWSTYTSGAYKNYLESVAADTSLTDPGEYIQDGSTPSGTPSSPAANPGSTYGPPLATGPGQFHVFGISPGGNLFQDTYASSWTGWQQIGNAGEALTGTPGIAYDPDNSTYHAFAIGATSGNVYQVTYAPSTGWSNWQNLGGVVQGGISAVYESGTFHVFAISPGGNLFQDTYASSWTGWQQLGNDSEALTSSPGIAYDAGNSSFHAFAQGSTSGNMYQVTYTPSTGWGNWQNLGGVLRGGFNATYVPPASG